MGGHRSGGEGLRACCTPCETTRPMRWLHLHLRPHCSIHGSPLPQIYTGTPIDLRTVVFIMDFSDCRMPQAPAVTKEVRAGASCGTAVGGHRSATPRPS